MLITKLSQLSPEGAPIQEEPRGEIGLQERLSLLFLEGEVRLTKAFRDDMGVSEWQVLGLLPDGVPINLACFESDLLTPRLQLELVSYDRPTPEAGWLFTTQADWALCWFPTNEVAVLPFAALKEMLVKEPARFEAATVLNAAGLAWNAIEDVDYLVWKLQGAQVLDMHYELNEPLKARKVLGAHNSEKECTADEWKVALLAASMESKPRKSPSDAWLRDAMSQLSAVNRMRNEPTHRVRIRTLPWKL